ncbi:sodium-dependent glucose transporter 1A-like isoform X2 [Brevipalpus obovatus]|uniref:sodium-dependent glucose transporter 1A-like isoform X2 n=1 Tax=Brevipalpus obovatus TaxID=246614 RepID=UPI003D9E0991
MDVQSGDNLSSDASQQTNKFDKMLLLACFFSLSFTMGLVYEILSPTLDDLANITDSSTVEISTLFQVRSGAYALGSLAGGIYHTTVPLISITIALLINMMSISWVGFLKNIFQMNFAVAINGFTTGIMDVGTNVYLLRSYQQKSPPYVLTLYAVFGLGCSFLNIYTAPFLSQKSSNLTSITVNLQDTNLSNQIVPEPNDVIWVPFLLTGIFNLGPLILFLILFFRQMRLPKNWRLPLMVSYGEQSRTQVADEGPRSQHTLILAIFSGLMIMFYCGVDIVFSEYLIVSLKRSSLGISSSQASYMKSAMLISHTAAKFLFIYISTLVKPATILITDCLLTLFSSIVLILSFDTSVELIWIFIVILGISTSSLYPSMLPFINEYLSIDHLNGSLMMFLGSIMAIIYPSIIGSFLDQEPAFSLYLETGTMIITLIFIFSIRHVGHQSSSENCPPSPSKTSQINDG